MTEHVKIYGVKPRIQYVADGELTTYDFPFATFSASDIEVYLQDVKQATNTYTVLDAGSSDGGSVVFNSAPTSGVVITIVRNLSIERTSDFQEGSTLRAKVLNDELDYQIACTQQIAENLNRSMVLPPYATDNDLDLTLPTPSAGKAIVWNSDGTNLENSTVSVNELEGTLNGYKIAAETAATTATTKAGIASDKADIATNQAQTATTQAGIATQKATEVSNALSTKANVALDNLTQAGKRVIEAFPFPSGISTDIPAQNNQQSTAPENGWICAEFITTSATNYGYGIINDSTNMRSMVRADSNGVLVDVYLPVKKGDTYRLSYDGTPTISFAKFIYAQGEV